MKEYKKITEFFNGKIFETDCFAHNQLVSKATVAKYIGNAKRQPKHADFWIKKAVQIAGVL